MFPIRILFSLLVSYILGSVPTAYWVGKFYKKIDIRLYGSGNVGATNAFRILGKGPGTVVLLIDIIKGILATTWVSDIFGIEQISLRILCGLMAVTGHNWTVFLNFKGGKGIATTLGVLIGLTMKFSAIRPVLLFTVLVWIIVFFLTGFISLASVLSSVALPVFMLLASLPLEWMGFGVAICIFVILRHRPNIKRLLSGEEPRVVLFKKNHGR